jgi:hypothetical protein
MAHNVTGGRQSVREPLVAIQVGAISFADEGVERVLDIVQERAGVNALMLACFTFTRGTGGRQVPGQPLPDHGVQEYDNFIGGSFTAIHPQYYAKTCITEFRAPDTATRDMDVMEAVLPACQRRGIAVYAWTVESIGMYVPNMPKVLQQDVFGRPQPRGCYANPDYRYWILSFEEDYCKSWPIAGVMWGSERRGPFEATLLGEVPYCFCEHCRANGRAQGIDVERARAGYEALYSYAQAAQRGQRPRDGYFVEFWRILFQYPEILQWEKLWFDQQQELHQQIYGVVKAIDRTKTVGWHIWHQNSFSPLFRAQWDFAKLRRYSDWLKPVLYNNCAGPRFHAHLAGWHRTWFADATPAETYAFLQKVLGYREGPYEQLPYTGFSADYVERETRRTVEGVNGEIPVYPGIDIDIPTEPGQTKCTPEGVRDAVAAAFRGGADGVILSRKYSEMRLANLSGAGEAVRAERQRRGLS